MTPPLKLDLPPQWDALEEARVRILEHVRQQGADDDTATAVAMVGRELAENATKYGSFSHNDTLGVEVDVQRSEIVVKVTNPVHAQADGNLRRLDEMIQWIRGFQDPFEAYLERLKEVSAQRLDSRESGLGLVRIAYEGRSLLDFFVDEAGTLTVSAVHPH